MTPWGVFRFDPKTSIETLLSTFDSFETAIAFRGKLKSENLRELQVINVRRMDDEGECVGA